MQAMFEKREAKLSTKDKESFKKSMAQAKKKLAADKEKLQRLRNKK